MDARVWRVGVHANLVGWSVGWLVLQQYFGVQYHYTTTHGVLGMGHSATRTAYYCCF